MNKSIITYIHTDRTVYHTSQPNLPNFYALHPKIAQKYFDVNNIPQGQRYLDIYIPLRSLKCIDIGKTEFVDDLLYQLLKGNYFYNRPDDALELLEALGIYSSKNIHFNNNQYESIEKKYNFRFPDCDKELIGDDIGQYFWNIAKIIIDTRKTIQRNSLSKLDYTIFSFLHEIYKSFGIDGFINYHNIPSSLACGFHHQELYIFEPQTKMEKVNTIQAGGKIEKYSMVPFTTGNPEDDEKLPAFLKNAMVRNYCPYYRNF